MEWGPGTCSRCGAEREVQPVTYVVDGESRTQLLCYDCKGETVVRTRVRVTEPTLPPQPTNVLPIAAWLALAAGALVIALTILGAVTR